MTSVLFLSGLAGFGLGCTTHQEQAEKSEFARLNRALELLQRAENDEKKPVLRAFEKMDCERLCSFRDQCLAAFQTHQRALDLLASLRARLDEEETARSPRGDEQKTAEQLARAKSLLVLSRSQTKQCAMRQGQLKRRLGR